MTLLADLRHAFRTLRRSPGFTIAAILTLAVGIGANAAIFTLVSRVFLRPLPFEHSDRLVLTLGRQSAFRLGSPAALLPQLQRSASRVQLLRRAGRLERIARPAAGAERQQRPGAMCSTPRAPRASSAPSE